MTRRVQFSCPLCGATTRADGPAGDWAICEACEGSVMVPPDAAPLKAPRRKRGRSSRDQRGKASTRYRRTNIPLPLKIVLGALLGGPLGAVAGGVVGVVAVIVTKALWALLNLVGLSIFAKLSLAIGMLGLLLTGAAVGVVAAFCVVMPSVSQGRARAPAVGIVLGIVSTLCGCALLRKVLLLAVGGNLSRAVGTDFSWGEWIFGGMALLAALASNVGFALQLMKDAGELALDE